ncbi:hypothetical protein GF325_00575 [Candidatus Bathyarchaeota archaeon]|nr:hypothetical protein [Candidatus Bathyarchaeota archaeon]
MVFKVGTCSDVTLEFKFKHMSSSRHLTHVAALERNWDEYTRSVLDRDLDCLIIAGNLFSTPKPRNSTVRVVLQSIERLTNAGIHVFVYPAYRDTPLYHANDDYPHVIFNTNPKVHVLKVEDRKQDEIIAPVFDDTVAGHPIEIFTTPDVFRELDDFNFDFSCNPGKISIFLMNGRFIGPATGGRSSGTNSAIAVDAKDDGNIDAREISGAGRQGRDIGDTDAPHGTRDTPVSRSRPRTIIDKLVKIDPGAIKRFKERGIDYIFLGGPNPTLSLDDNETPGIITCPQLNPIDFNFLGLDHGISIIHIDAGVGHVAKVDQVIHSFYHLDSFKHDLTYADPRISNREIIALIKKHVRKDSVVQLRLCGEMARQQYHHLDIYKYVELGMRRGIYFELSDEIEFESKAEEISGLDPLLELENLVQGHIREEPGKKQVLESALVKIRNDWKNV